MPHNLPFNISDILKLCGIDFKGVKTSEYVYCPFCNTKKKLNINFSDDVFNCPKCGKGGGMIDLYQSIFSVPDKKQAIKEIKSALNIQNEVIVNNNNRKSQNKKIQNQKKEPNVVMIDKCYREFLGQLSLSSRHKNELLFNRHITEENIEKYLFRSVPVFGYKKLAENLSKKYDLTQVAGFYYHKEQDWHGWDINLNSKMTGIIIPAFSVNGLIKGLSIRLDKPIHKTKYIWFSSDDLAKGNSSHSPAFFVQGENRPNQVILTEGSFKAIITNQEWGVSVYSLGGVNNTTYLEQDLKLLKDKGFTEVVECFDSDYRYNDFVKEAKLKIKEYVLSAGLKHSTFEWTPEEGKGLDDYILNKKKS